MIYETTYKDRPAIAVEGNNLTAVFLPEDGGKLASLKTASGGGTAGTGKEGPLSFPDH